MGKSCWNNIQILLVFLIFKLLPNFIFQCYRPQTQQFHLFVTALSICAIYKVFLLAGMKVVRLAKDQFGAFKNALQFCCPTKKNVLCNQAQQNQAEGTGQHLDYSRSTQNETIEAVAPQQSDKEKFYLLSLLSFTRASVTLSVGEQAGRKHSCRFYILKSQLLSNDYNLILHVQC